MIQTADGSVQLDADASASMLRLETKAAAVRARFNGEEAGAVRDAGGVWTTRGTQGAQ